MHGEQVRLTYQDFCELPDDGRRYEIHEGELVVNPAPGPSHQRAIGNLYVALRPHVEARELGEVLLSPLDCILTDETIVEPDLVYVTPEQLGRVSERGVEGPPTLVVEVLSRSTARIDKVRKLQLYARYGVPYYWIVDPASLTIQAFALQSGRYTEVGHLTRDQSVALPPFPELMLDPAMIWRIGRPPAS